MEPVESETVEVTLSNAERKIFVDKALREGKTESGKTAELIREYITR